MNPDHLWAFVWLRWRLRMNQLRKGGIVSQVLLAVLAVGLAVFAAGATVGGLLAGLLLFREASPAAVLFTWDGLTAVFLFVWAVGLLAELQRAEALALDRFLHLPVSLLGAFLVNYVSSLFSLTLAVFGPAAAGLALGMVFARGPAMLLVFPLLLAFLLAVTAVTYLVQGWLAGLMTNPRRRRTIIAGLTIGLVALAQAPNLWNILRVTGENKADAGKARLADREAELQRDLAAGKLSPAEHAKRVTEARAEQQAEAKAAGQQRWADAERTARVANAVIPPGWLPLGAAGLAEGRVGPALLGALGFTAVGVVSLWRAYRATVRLYTGAGGDGGDRPAAAPAGGPAPADGRPRLEEWRLPGVSEHAAAVAAAGVRSLLRAPEAKMMLLAPVLMVAVFGGMFLSGAPAGIPAPARPVIAFAAGAVLLLMAVQLVGNQFGYDRGGFRAYVLSPAPRRDILLGKNLAVAPVLAGLGLLAAAAVQVACPMRADHLVAALAQFGAMALVFLLLANALAILAPVPIAAGALQPQTIRAVPALMQVGFLAVFPVALAPTLLPLGLEVLLAEVWGVRGVPVALLGSAVVLLAAVAAYRKVLTWEGRLLAAREQAVLEVVTSKAE